MLISLLHRTTFTYAAKARDSFNEVRLRPVDDLSQACRSFELRTDPPSQPREYVDFYGNTVHYFDVVDSHAKLVVEALSEVETVPNALRKPVPRVPVSAFDDGADRELHAEFLTDSHYVPLDVEIWKEARDAINGGQGDVWGDVCALCRHVFRNFAYRPKSTGVGTTAADALRLRSGVCQDFAHVALGLCRCSGVPARYVSGYFIKLKGMPDESEDEASHAWIEAFIPGYGWAAFDPTHDRPADDRYVKVASGRDYADIRPVSGTYRGGKTRSLLVEVRVRESEAAGAI
jgi:transglutaminase-like putative cysteine protease